MNEHKEFIALLEHQRDRYIEILEELLGERDQNFLIGSIAESTHQEDVPQTYFPLGFRTDGGCVVDIQISSFPWRVRSPSQGTWQVAHECVHIMDPGEAETNVLEEGLATWFQDELAFHTNPVRAYIENKERNREFAGLNKNYFNARELVRACMPQLGFAVKEIRSSNVKLREVSSEVLSNYLPNFDRNIVDSLCNKIQH